MMVKKISKLMGIIFILTFLAGCSGLTANTNGELKASGTISAREVNIAPEIAGTVSEVNVQESQAVKTGDTLIKLDQSLLQAQLDSSNAAITLAEANVKTAEAALATAQIQYQQMVNNAHLLDAVNRTNLWKKGQPDDVQLPGWYFEKSERMAAADLDLKNAQKNLEAQKAGLVKAISTLNLPGLADIEKRLSEAEASFKTAKAMLDLANNAADQVQLQKAAQDQYDNAKDILNKAEQEYNDLLNDKQADELMKARALIALAQQTYDEALDRYNSLLTADDSLQVAAAKAVVDQAQAAVDQVNAALAQTKAAKAVLDVQLTKTLLSAPTDGVILTRNVEPGEMASPGSTLLVIGELATVKLTVYVPENRYGEIKLGQSVTITVDSFPGETFTGSVKHIADKAEFTPRNVQTVDGRRTTVYAIEIEVPNPDFKLKSGMPADVVFK
jgi:HlyD family secretion protein